MEHLIHTLEHAFFDSITILPFLFIAFLVIEYTEHRIRKRQSNILNKTKKVGPLIGSLLGVFPQCGFSVMATNFYASRIVTLGTLISVYLVTSDEMLIIMLAEKAPLDIIISIIGIKVVIGILFGFIIDYFFVNKKNVEKENFDICADEHCGCEHSILKGALVHTLKIFLFIFVFSALIDFFVHEFGEESLGNLFLKDNFFAPFITGLIGLIPNCAASIIITELYLSEAISFGAVIAGLLTGAGAALLVLFRTNKNLVENLKIVFLLYSIGVLSGLIINLF